MKYLKSFKIYENVASKSATLVFDETLTNLILSCKITADNMIDTTDPNFPKVLKSRDIYAVDQDNMDEVFKPFIKVGLNVIYKGSEDYIEDEEFGGRNVVEEPGYFQIKVEDLNNAIKSNKIKLEPQSDDPEEDYFNVKIVK